MNTQSIGQFFLLLCAILFLVMVSFWIKRQPSSTPMIESQSPSPSRIASLVPDLTKESLFTKPVDITKEKTPLVTRPVDTNKEATATKPSVRFSPRAEILEAGSSIRIPTSELDTKSALGVSKPKTPYEVETPVTPKSKTLSSISASRAPKSKTSDELFGSEVKKNFQSSPTESESLSEDSSAKQTPKKTPAKLSPLNSDIPAFSTSESSEGEVDLQSPRSPVDVEEPLSPPSPPPSPIPSPVDASTDKTPTKAETCKYVCSKDESSDKTSDSE